jgi:hypothetical protein
MSIHIKFGYVRVSKKYACIISKIGIDILFIHLGRSFIYRRNNRGAYDGSQWDTMFYQRPIWESTKMMSHRILKLFDIYL